MSWSIDITAKTDIKKEDIEDIKKNLQTAADIWDPEGNKLTVSGAGFSRHLSADMVAHIKKELRKKGYTYVRNSKRRD
jgi:hypothetical protein